MITYYSYTSSEEYPSDEDPQFDSKDQAMIDINKNKEKYDLIILWYVVIDSDTFIHMEKVFKVSRMPNGTHSWLWYM
jgi:hypothetical protein